MTHRRPKGFPLPDWVRLHCEQTDSGCQQWTRGLNRGYGRLNTKDGSQYTHRIIWEETNGPVPSGMCVDHICHNRSCCELSHLRLVSAKENSEHRSPRSSNSNTGYRGVCWSVAYRAYVVKVGHGGRLYHGGSFARIEDARAAVTALRNKLHTNNDKDREDSYA